MIVGETIEEIDHPAREVPGRPDRENLRKKGEKVETEEKRPDLKVSGFAPWPLSFDIIYIQYLIVAMHMAMSATQGRVEGNRAILYSATPC